MEVICIEDKAFYDLVSRVVEQLKIIHPRQEAKWVNTEEAMRLLNIKSKTSLQNLRDAGKIRFTQPQKKLIMYDRDSINSYLENNAQNTF